LRIQHEQHEDHQQQQKNNREANNYSCDSPHGGGFKYGYSLQISGHKVGQ
jgi:hypothetical protein